MINIKDDYERVENYLNKKLPWSKKRVKFGDFPLFCISSIFGESCILQVNFVEEYVMVDDFKVPVTFNYFEVLLILDRIIEHLKKNNKDFLILKEKHKKPMEKKSDEQAAQQFDSI